MGLDISAYKNVKKVDVSELDEYEREDLCKIFCNGFKDQYSSLEVGAFYDGENEHFCRIGYGGYSLFRERLAEIGGWGKHIVPNPDCSDSDYDNQSYYHRFPHIADIYHQEGDTVDGPFVEIIIFSDCEGFIDAIHCKKLYEDFCKFEEVAKVRLKDELNFMNFYKSMKEAFKFGSENGFVNYH